MDSSMKITQLDHFTLRISPEQLPELLGFYTRVLQLREGARPAFPFPGHWLYAGDLAVVHLAGNQPAGEPQPLPSLPTGRFNHISLKASDLKGTREHLAALGVEWQEAPVPGMPLHQVFLRDPVGLKIELTFSSAELDLAGPSPKAIAY
jgi:catechol 2,3-dioxygenase-like lactoylglutathione lyase family enzyme